MSDSDYLAQLTPDAVVLYPSRAKLLLFALIAAAFVVGCFFMWNDPRPKYRVVAVVGGVFFGLAMLFLFARLVRRVPALIVNQSGIFDNSSGIGGYFLRWEEIDSMYVSSINRQKFLSIRLKDPERFLSQQGGMKARLMRANVKLVGAPVNISANILPVKLEELIRIIQERAPAVRVS